MYASHAVTSALPQILIVLLLVSGALLPYQPRTLQALVLMAMIAALADAGRRIARRLVPELDGPAHATAAFTFAAALAIVPATALGHFGLLRPAAFLVWVAAAYLASRALAPPLPFAETGRGGEGRTETALLAAAAGALVWAGMRSVALAALNPPGRFHFDDISYHLSAVAVWHRFGDLRMVRFAMGDPSTPFYPIAGEISSWVFLAPFRDSDFAARWSQLPFALFSLVAVAALALRTGQTWRSAALAAVLYGSIRKVMPDLALSAGNDHVASFFTLAGLLGVLETARRPRPGAAVFAGVAVGLAVGTKYIGLINAATLVGVLGVVWLARRGEADGLRPALAALLLLGATAAVVGGYTYLRNAVTAGNPVFPAPVHALGLPGWEETSLVFRRSGDDFKIDVRHFLTQRRDLFGPLFAFTQLPAALLAPLVALFRRGVPRGDRVETAVVLGLPAVFFLEFLFLMHDHRENRYFLAGIALAAVAFSWLLERTGRAGPVLRSAVLVMVTFHALWRLGLDSWRAALYTLVLIALASILVRARERLPAWPGPVWRRRAGWTGAVAVLALSAALGPTVAAYQKAKLRDQPALLALERFAGPGGAAVAYVGWNQSYPFFGRRLENRVEILPRSGDPGTQYYDWGASVEPPFKGGTTKKWRQVLDRQGVEMVVVVRSPFEDPERKWMLRRPRQFRRIYRDSGTEVWRVRPGDAETGRTARAGR